MFNNFLNYYFSTTNTPNDEQSKTALQSAVHSNTCMQVEYEEFLPEVYNTWDLIHQLSLHTTSFRKNYDQYIYERSNNRKKQSYWNELKLLDDVIYKLSLTIHERIQMLEKTAQPLISEFSQHNDHGIHSNSIYVPAYIRIAQNQLNSLKLTFKRIITDHDTNSIDYQKALKQSIENHKITNQFHKDINPMKLDERKSMVHSDDGNRNVIKPIAEEQHIQSEISNDQKQQDLTKQELEIADLEARLDSIRMLQERVRQMNEMTMALYLSVQDQNDLADNIWLNTTTGSDYIAQSVDEFRLLKQLKHSKINLWIKVTCIVISFLLVLIFILTMILIFGPK